jgi:hypothetical protein
MGLGTLEPSAYIALAGNDWGESVLLTLATYDGHFNVVKDDTLPTSYSQNNLELIRPNTRVYSGYPVNFDICLASRQQFDYMTQVPSELMAKYSVYTTPARCTSSGTEHLQVHSKILGIEKLVTGSNADLTHCPSTRSIRDDVYAASRNLRFMSPSLAGIPCHVNDNTLSVICGQAGPTTADAMYFHGDDAYYIRSYWITFLEVHIKAIHKACSVHIGESYTIGDPWGLAAVNVEMSLSEMLTMRNKYEQLWPRTNAPHESKKTLMIPKNYTMKLFRDYAYSSELVCKDDPVARMRSFVNMMFLTGAGFIEAMTPQLQAAFGTPTPEATVCQMCGMPCASLGPVFIDPDVTCVMSDIFPKTCQTCPGVTSVDC